MKFSVDECYELTEDYQSQFLGDEVFPNPKYDKVQLSKRTINQVHYDDVYILEPNHYYYVTFDIKIPDNITEKDFKINNKIKLNGLLFSLDIKNNRIFLFNASQNFVCLQKNTKIGELFLLKKTRRWEE